MSFALDSLTGHVIDVDSGTLEGQLTRPQRTVLRGVILANSRYRAPTLQDIADCCGRTAHGGFAPSGIHLYLRQLADKGYVELGPPGQKRREVRVLKEQ